jgi:peptidoglycan/xylan/chitin deacetylase (PgdA/CDA1 family)/glycosyltransferase involved in cell wall biosynthesis
MNILHVLSQFEVTGAEVYAATLMNEQVRRNHTVFVVSDTFSTPTLGTYLPLPIGNRSYLQRLSNIRSLVKLIHTHHIDIIHAHSRAASWVSHFASRRTGIPLVSTVHGRQHVHASSRSFSVYGENVIAVSESLKDHLIADLGLQSAKITVIPNGLDWRRSRIVKPPPVRAGFIDVSRKNKVILFIGRLTGPKGDVVYSLISKVMPRVVKEIESVLYVIGGEKRPTGFKDFIERANKDNSGPLIKVLDFQSDIYPFLNRADLVVGSGRVVMEALALGRPTIAFGESNYVGRVTPENFVDAAKSNFGDTGIHSSADGKIVANDIVATLRRGSHKRDAERLKVLTRQRFDIAGIEPRIEAVYKRAQLRANFPPQIPILVYHRVVAEPARESKHGIWVTTGQFESHLKSLQRRGFSTITFCDVEDIRLRKRSLPQKPIILTFDDGYEDNYTNALPILQKYRSTAVVFVVADQKRRTNHWDPDEPTLPLMSWEHLREMVAAGIEIGSHTVTHANLPTLSQTASHQEIVRSKATLERELGKKVLSFAYPYGALNDEIKQMVKEAGYSYAVGGDGGSTSFVDDFFEVRRTQIFPWTSAFGFWKKTQPWYLRLKEMKR